MRKIFYTYIPGTLFLVFLAMVLVSCGGDGGGDSSQPQTDLIGLSINGPASMNEYSTATYTATASWSDTSASTVTPTWSVNSQMASISPSGVLACPPIDNDEAVTITATYSSGGITETANMDVTITKTTIPFTAQMLSGEAFFEENFPAGEGYDSYLSIFNADFSCELYSHGTFPDRSDYETGTWSIDASGNLIITVGGQETITVMLIADSSTEMEVVVDDGTGTPETEILEKILPATPSVLPGTYTGSDGYTWVFNADGTGSVSIFGGTSFTWSVDSGILKMVAGNGYQMWFYVRPGTTAWATYILLKVGFVELTPTGGFYEYYGGYELTRQRQ